MATNYTNVGTEKSKITVRLSYKIISLFSEGLYSSPHKAIEELVANAFDAGASNVHVVLPTDFTDPSAEIFVVDDGSGMDEEGLKTHWLIGESNKRNEQTPMPKGRKPIGRFGIGKLSTYVLAKRFTHLTKVGKAYYLTSMDYGAIPTKDSPDPVQLSLRKLNEKQAQATLSKIDGKKAKGYRAIKLFGPGAVPTWTVAILSDLKEMAQEIQRGRLRWILSTAMPLRDDFKLYLTGDPVQSSKIDTEKYGSWTLGKDLLVSPVPDGYEVNLDESAQKNSPKYFGLLSSSLGRVFGYAELYKEVITGGKSGDLSRSHGFFIYVRERLINLSDEYFGIDSNLLRHGTFSRLRVVLHVDNLDIDLRSSRESLLESSRVAETRLLLKEIFNAIRTKHNEFEETEDPTKLVARRISAGPASLIRRPLHFAIAAALSGAKRPRLILAPKGLTKNEQEELLAKFEISEDETEESAIRSIVLDSTLEPSQGLALFEPVSQCIRINEHHPFVAYFQDAFRRSESKQALQLIATSEVLLEASLLSSGLDESKVDEIVRSRDELLRTFARTSAIKGPNLVAQELEDAASDKDRLEKAVVAAFDSLGFSNAIPIGGPGKPDGYAEARLASSASYKVTLEAKSKETGVGKVSAKTVGVSLIAKHRADHQADHAIVVGPDFPSHNEDASLSSQLAADKRANNGKTITVIKISQLAKLVRIAPARRIGLRRLRDLFQTCSMPEECEKWMNGELSKPEAPNHYEALLRAISSEQSDLSEPVEYAHVQSRLRISEKVSLEKEEIIELCRAVEKMAPGYLYARENTVELEQRPDLVLQAIAARIQTYPEEEQAFLKSFSQ